MKKLPALILTLIIVFNIAACAPKGSTAEYKIVTSFYPVMLLTKMVTENVDGVTVSNLASPETGCLHDYALLPDDLKNLEDADLFVINGLGMEAFLDKTINTLPDLKIVDLSSGINPVNNNAHIWLAPLNAQKMISTLCTELSDAVPEYSGQFSANKKKYTDMLTELDNEIKAQKLEGNGVITCHEAFDYFANQYNLQIDGVIQREPGEEPTTKELIKTTELIRQKGTKVLLVEPQYRTTAAETLARETGARIFRIDPIVTGKNEDLPIVYFDKARQNLQTLNKAFKGAENNE